MNKKILSVLLAFALLLTGIPMNTAEAAKIKLNKTSLSMTVGDSFTLKLTGVKKGKISWGSSDKKIVSVTQKGKIKAKKKGLAAIAAIYKNKNYVCMVTVKKKGETKATPTPTVTPTPMPEPDATETPEPQETDSDDWYYDNILWPRISPKRQKIVDYINIYGKNSGDNSKDKYISKTKTYKSKNGYEVLEIIIMSYDSEKDKISFHISCSWSTNEYGYIATATIRFTKDDKKCVLSHGESKHDLKTSDTLGTFNVYTDDIDISSISDTNTVTKWNVLLKSGTFDTMTETYFIEPANLYVNQCYADINTFIYDTLHFTLYDLGFNQ